MPSLHSPAPPVPCEPQSPFRCVLPTPSACQEPRNQALASVTLHSKEGADSTITRGGLNPTVLAQPPSSGHCVKVPRASHRYARTAHLPAQTR